MSALGSSLHGGKYRADIDGMRAIAVTSVVVSHAFPAVLPGGFIGVDIFFVISGYLISSIIIRELERGSFSILTFYSRRVRRIFPALILVLAATLAFGWYCLFTPEFRQLGWHIAASTLFSENLLLWSEVSYFDTDSTLKPTLHLWSLAIEEQFYILWPVFLFLAFRFKWGVGRVLIGLALISFITNLVDLQRDPTAAYYSPLGRAWELLIGALLAWLEISHPQVINKMRMPRFLSVNLSDLQSWLGLSLIIIALALVGEESAFPGFWALLPTCGTFLLISAGPGAWVNRRILALPPMVGCGLISYPLYLWHWPPLSFTAIIFTEVTAKKAAACVLFAVVAAWLTFRFVEMPIRRGGKISHKVRYLVGGLVAGMAAPLLAGALVATDILPSRLWQVNVPSRNEWSFLKEKYPRYNSNMEGIYDFHETRPERVLFIGDSHLAQYIERLDRIIIGDPSQPGMTMILGGGCIPIEYTRGDDKSRRNCWALRDQAFRIAEGPEFDRIVIGGAWNWYFLDPKYYFQKGDSKFPLNLPEGRRLALEQLAQRIRSLEAAGKTVTFILDNPVLAGSVPRRKDLRTQPVTAELMQGGKAAISVDHRQKQLHAELHNWAARMKIRVIDPFAPLCPDDQCLITTQDGRLQVYVDPGHFNPEWALENAKFIDRALSAGRI